MMDQKTKEQLDKFMALPGVQAIKRSAIENNDGQMIIHLRKMLRDAKAIGYGEGYLRGCRQPPERREA